MAGYQIYPSVNYDDKNVKISGGIPFFLCYQEVGYIWKLLWCCNLCCNLCWCCRSHHLNVAERSKGTDNNGICFLKICLFNLFIFGCFGSLLLCRLSLVVVSGGYSLLQCAGFSL